MSFNQLWNVVQQKEGIVLNRWTKSGNPGKPFTYEVRATNRGESLRFLRDGREFKSASRSRFEEVFEGWHLGIRDADNFENKGLLQSTMEVAKFLIPIIEMVEKTQVTDEAR